MKKLYTVTFETEIVVVAEDDDGAMDAARDAMYEGIDGLEPQHPRPMSYLPSDWDLSAIPFGEREESDPDRNIGKWVELGAAPEYKAKRVLRKRGVTRRMDGDSWVEEPCTCVCHEPGSEGMKHLLPCCGAPKKCPKCCGIGILPNVMDGKDGPVCACGKPSRHESGHCGEEHGAIYCDCEVGKSVRDA